MRSASDEYIHHNCVISHCDARCFREGEGLRGESGLSVSISEISNPLDIRIEMDFIDLGLRRKPVRLYKCAPEICDTR